MTTLRWIARPCWQVHGPAKTFRTLARACKFAYRQAEQRAVTYRVWRTEEGKPACCIAWFMPSYERLQRDAAQAKPAA